MSSFRIVGQCDDCRGTGWEAEGIAVHGIQPFCQTCNGTGKRERNRLVVNRTKLAGDTSSDAVFEVVDRVTGATYPFFSVSACMKYIAIRHKSGR